MRLRWNEWSVVLYGPHRLASYSETASAVERTSGRATDAPEVAYPTEQSAGIAQLVELTADASIPN